MQGAAQALSADFLATLASATTAVRLLKFSGPGSAGVVYLGICDRAVCSYIVLSSYATTAAWLLTFLGRQEVQVQSENKIFSAIPLVK
jgi:hypothetical protein